MTTYFVTGGEGFLGYHLCQELLSDPNNKVIIYDALKHFVPLSKSYWCYYQNYRVKTLNSERLVRIRGDMLSKSFLQSVLEEHKPDIIIHLASLPIADVSNQHSEEATQSIFMATITLLDVIKSLSYKIKRLVYISSSMVYGDFKRDENGNILSAKEGQECSPKCLYGTMKLCSEIAVKTYNKRFGIPFVIVRPSAIYGPTDCNGRVTELYLNGALLGKELILDNGGLHQLDFTYVKDIAHGLVLAATSEKAIGETFNITRGEGRSIKELAEILLKLIPNTGCKTITKAVDVYRPNRGSLDISKARNLLGYEPKYSLEKGLAEYVNFVQNTIVKDNALLTAERYWLNKQNSTECKSNPAE